MAKKKGIDLDVQKVISWCKGNIVLVILIFVCIAAVIGLPRMASGWEEGVTVKLRDRASNFSKLDNLAGTQVTPPGTNNSERVVVNQSLVDDYKVVTDAMQGDATQVVSKATTMNRKEYEVLFASTLFPSPSSAQAETLPQLFYRQLEMEYKSLLEVANAGVPPTQEELVEALEDARVRFMETNLSTRHDADLTQEQRDSLENHLAKLRISELRSRAESISVYLDESALNIPEFDVTAMPSVGELFVWQWRYWIIADMIGAMSSINQDQTEVTSPIKRVVALEVLGLPTINQEPSRGGGGGSGGSGGSGGGTPPRPPMGGGRPNPFGGGGTGAPNPFGGGGTPSPAPSGGGRPSKPDETGLLASSHTGRKSGPLYDLMQVRMKMIVDTERIPEILDGFAQYNFFTIIDLDLKPIDKFIALGHGFDYGPASVSELTVVFETAWLRSWTTEYMPDSVKRSIGIDIKQ